jgi:hypothetical protein
MHRAAAAPQGDIDVRAGFTMCEAIWYGAAANCSGEYRTCAATRGPAPFAAEL